MNETFKKCMAVAGILAFTFSGTVAAESMMPDRLLLKDGKMMALKQGALTEMQEEMTLPNGTKVSLKGEVVTKDGRKSTLKEGEMITMAGTIVPRTRILLRDCVVMKAGKMMILKEGKLSEMKEETTLGDGTKVTVDGKVERKDGETMKLDEGEAILLDGRFVHRATLPPPTPEPTPTKKVEHKQP